ncbi:MAG TPA: ATP-binding protein [Propionibacteriaceae bacterium]|nr:ATP-binding protein [Propionibacteriaceae bacterium]
MDEPPRLSPAELKTLFLFEALEEDQLDWLSERGRVELRSGGTSVYEEGEDATCFFVLLSGTLSMLRRVEDTEVETVRTNQRGVYSGATQAFVRTPDTWRYPNSVRAVTDCEFWVIDGTDFGEKVRVWFPMAMHLLEGLMVGFRNSQSAIGARERLLSLGRLSAGLTHELNNPAAAAVRATAALRERVSKMRRKLAHLATAKVDPEGLTVLTELQEVAVEKMAKAEKLSPMQVADAEDVIGDWLDDHGVGDGWDLAATLVAAGVDEAWLDEIADTLPSELLSDGIHWVTYALETEQLMMEIEDSTERISHLVGAAKQYSQLDRAAHQEIDVHDGLISTLTMLNYKIKESGKIALLKDFAPDLPLIPAHPAELNQVWTNLIDNAIQAMPEGGTLTVRTRRDDDHVVVEIGDTGVGIPEDLHTKIFEPFFTTKPVGQGTGLGLDICYRVVTQRHGGDLRVVSRPGDTRFVVRLPVNEPPSLG